MGTQVRDAMVAALNKAEGKYASAEAMAKKAGVAVNSAAAALAGLAKKGIAKRERNGKEFEYTVGPRIAFGLKHAGHRFPNRKHAKQEEVNGEAVPASSGMAGIVIKLEGSAHAITLGEAKALFNELKVLFG